jgi:2-(1,2-epoxy-1,2-dihydrophenyl)acetyl-CoA isomerase
MSNVVVHRDAAVATIELNRPEQLNALNAATRKSLAAALADAADDDSVRAVVLTGAGRAFCVGQDLAAAEELADAGRTVAETYNPLVRAITGMGKPVIAAVNGPAVGAGMGLALACDVVVMTAGASFSCAFGKMALVPDTGTSWFLARRIGHARAFAAAVTGRKIDAAEALALGLANEVVPDRELRSVAAATAAELAAGPALAFALTKQLLTAAAEQPLDVILEMEARGQGQAAASADHAERRAAFLARRPR